MEGSDIKKSHTLLKQCKIFVVLDAETVHADL